MAAEVVPVTVKSRKGDVVVDTDEEFSKVNFDKLKQLKAVFQKGACLEILYNFPPIMSRF